MTELEENRLLERVKRLEGETDALRRLLALATARLDRSSRDLEIVRSTAEDAVLVAGEASEEAVDEVSDLVARETEKLLPAKPQPFAYEVMESNRVVYCYVPKKPEGGSSGDEVKEFCGGAYGGPHLGSKEQPKAPEDAPPHASAGYQGVSASQTNLDFSWSHYGWVAVGTLPESGSVADYVVVASFKVPLDPAPVDRTDDTEVEGPSLSGLSLMSISDWKAECKKSWKEFDDLCGSATRKIPIAFLANGLVTQLCMGVPFVERVVRYPRAWCEPYSTSDSDSDSDTDIRGPCWPSVDIEDVPATTAHPSGGYKITVRKSDCTEVVKYIWNCDCDDGSGGDGGGGSGGGSGGSRMTCCEVLGCLAGVPAPVVLTDTIGSNTRTVLLQGRKFKAPQSEEYCIEFENDGSPVELSFVKQDFLTGVKKENGKLVFSAATGFVLSPAQKNDIEFKDCCPDDGMSGSDSDLDSDSDGDRPDTGSDSDSDSDSDACFDAPKTVKITVHYELSESDQLHGDYTCSTLAAMSKGYIDYSVSFAGENGEVMRRSYVNQTLETIGNPAADGSVAPERDDCRPAISSVEDKAYVKFGVLDADNAQYEQAAGRFDFVAEAKVNGPGTVYFSLTPNIGYYGKNVGGGSIENGCTNLATDQPFGLRYARSATVTTEISQTMNGVTTTTSTTETFDFGYTPATMSYSTPLVKTVLVD